MPSSLARETIELNKRFWNLRSFCHLRDYLLVCKVRYGGFALKQQDCYRHWESWVLEKEHTFFREHKDFFPSFGLSQHSEGCPTLGSHQVSFHPLGLQLRTDLQILSKLVMYNGWEIQIALSAGANKVMSHYRMRSQHRVLTLYMHGGEPKHEFIEELAKCFSLTLQLPRVRPDPTWLQKSFRKSLDIALHFTQPQQS